MIKLGYKKLRFTCFSWSWFRDNQKKSTSEDPMLYLSLDCIVVYTNADVPPPPFEDRRNGPPGTSRCVIVGLFLLNNCFEASVLMLITGSVAETWLKLNPISTAAEGTHYFSPCRIRKEVNPTGWLASTTQSLPIPGAYRLFQPPVTAAVQGMVPGVNPEMRLPLGCRFQSVQWFPPAALFIMCHNNCLMLGIVGRSIC